MYNRWYSPLIIFSRLVSFIIGQNDRLFWEKNQFSNPVWIMFHSYKSIRLIYHFLNNSFYISHLVNNIFHISHFLNNIFHFFQFFNKIFHISNFSWSYILYFSFSHFLKLDWNSTQDLQFSGTLGSPIQENYFLYEASLNFPLNEIKIQETNWEGSYQRWPRYSLI